MRRSVAWGLLAALLFAGTALAQEAPPPSAPDASAVQDAGDGLQPRARYDLLWRHPCGTPSFALDLAAGPADLPHRLESFDLPFCATSLHGGAGPLADTGLWVPIHESRSVDDKASLTLQDSRAREGQEDAPVLEGAGEAWAHPARARGRFWAETVFQVDGIPMVGADVALGRAPAGPPALEPVEAAPAAAGVDPAPPAYPVFDAAPVAAERADAPAALRPSEFQGIRVDAPEPQGLGAAAQRVRSGISGTPFADERVVVAGFLLLALGVALYQRITPDRSIQHETRAAIHQILTERAEGATAGDVGRLLGMNRKTAEYHLNYLARLGTVRTGLDESGARLYSLRTIPERKSLVERMLLLVRQRPGLSIPEYAGLLGVSRSSADRHAKALVVQGTLESRLVEGERRLYEPGV